MAGGKLRFWRIRGYDSTKLIFEMTVPVGQLTQEQLKHVLRALTAKAGLNFREIVGAFAKRRTALANDLLEVHRDGPYTMFWCGNSPHFLACVVDGDGTVLRPTLP